MTGKHIFINLPTKNVAAAREFYEKLGFEINKDFSNSQNVFVAIAENVQLILADEAFLREMGETRDFANASKVTEVSVVVSVGSRQEVDEVFEKAIAAGGKQAGETTEEAEIGLYARAFSDPDGHKVDINYMAV